MTQSTTQFYRKLALFGYFGLLVWVPLWHFVLAEGIATSALFTFLLWIVPLLLPMRGLIKGTPYTYAWANFIVLLYFLHGLTAVYAVSDEWLYAIIELIFATCMFTGCVFYARLRGKELGTRLKSLKEVMAEEKRKFEGHE